MTTILNSVLVLIKFIGWHRSIPCWSGYPPMLSVFLMMVTCARNQYSKVGKILFCIFRNLAKYWPIFQQYINNLAYLDDFYYIPGFIGEVSFFVVFFHSLLYHWICFVCSSITMVLWQKVPILIKHFLYKTPSMTRFYPGTARWTCKFTLCLNTYKIYELV